MPKKKIESEHLIYIGAPAKGRSECAAGRVASSCLYHNPAQTIDVGLSCDWSELVSPQDSLRRYGSALKDGKGSLEQRVNQSGLVSIVVRDVRDNSMEVEHDPIDDKANSLENNLAHSLIVRGAAEFVENGIAVPPEHEKAHYVGLLATSAIWAIPPPCWAQLHKPRQ